MKLIKIQNIILHHSWSRDNGELDWPGIRNYHVKDLGWDAIGYHYGIELYSSHYEILTGRFMDVEGAHCRDKGMNHKSLGLCLIGNFDEVAPPEKQWKAAVDLTRSICSRFNLSISSILGHREAGSSKTCPGLLFDMDKFRTEVHLAL